MAKTFLPTAIKFHYLFTLRDLSNVYQGVMYSISSVTKTLPQFARLVMHECCRVYGDKLVDTKDQETFAKCVQTIFTKGFEQHIHRQHIHTVASSANTVSNALLKYVMAAGGASQADIDAAVIKTYNQPMPLNATEIGKMSSNSANGENGGQNYAGDLTFMVCLIVSLFVKYKVNEDILKAKHVQSLTGMSTVTYRVVLQKCHKNA